ncbi:hypothetical protein OWV82_015898 [Melia azedarach]|uniref:Uncharacterized protein n=1 Tax=Melia azedarach TaxID=155640 RepID=A0ACC1XR51_MELAZ|nr:hypothetical protein OWV82_015898 [Melia azedarach]
MEADERKSVMSCSIDFDEDQLRQPASEHLWLLYLSNQELYRLSWNFDSSQVKLSFDSLRRKRLQVKRCGVYPVYVDGNISESDGFVVEPNTDVAITSEESTTEYDEPEGEEEEEARRRERSRLNSLLIRLVFLILIGYFKFFK